MSLTGKKQQKEKVGKHMKKSTYSNEIAKAVEQFLKEKNWHFDFLEKAGLFKFDLKISSKIRKIKYVTINEQISNFAQTYPTNLTASPTAALLAMRRYRFANCSCFSCCFKDAYPSSNVQ